MTTRIEITLTDRNNGIWTSEYGAMVAGGVKIPDDQDYWQLAKDLMPSVSAYVRGLAIDDLILLCVDDRDEVVCQFRVLNGSIEAQV